MTNWAIERFERIQDYIGNWTGEYVLPDLCSAKFQKLIKGVAGIIRSTMRDDASIKLQYTNSTVAYCSHPLDNPNSITINIPKFYLSRDFYEILEYNNDDTLPYYVLATIAFVITHETIHSLYTPYSVKQEELLNSKFCDSSSARKTILFTISNLYEDNAIHSVSRYESYGYYIQNGLDIVLNRETFEFCKSKVAEQFELSGKVDLQELISLITNLRNADFFDDPIWDCEFNTRAGYVVDLSKIRDIFLNSMSVVEYNDAYLQQHADDVYQIMEILCPQDEFNKYYRDESDQFSDYVMELIKSIQRLKNKNGERQGINFVPDFDNIVFTGESDDENAPNEDSILIEIEDLVEEIFKEVEGEEVKRPTNEKWKAQPVFTEGVKLIDLSKRETQDKTPELAPEYLVFGKIMSVLKTRMHQQKPIIHDTSGDELALDNLHNWKRTREVFKESVRSSSLELDTEIAIVGDMSGSMTSDELYKQMLQALYSIGVSLRNSRSKFALYCHTTSRTTDIYFLGGNIKQQGEIEIGISNAYQINMSGNNDADVIEWVYRNAFTSKKNRKFIFMLSDGLPCQSARGAESGLDTHDYMRFIIEVGRNEGYNIYGIALTDSVIRSNEELYGENYTIDASVDLEIKLKEIVLGIQKGIR